MLKRDSKTGASSGEGDGHGEERPPERSVLAEDKSRALVDRHLLKEMMRDRLPLKVIKLERVSASSIRM